MKKLIKIAIFIGAGMMLNACYYDKYDELNAYRNLTNPCDSASVTYTKNISKIMSSYCLSCHDGTSAGHSLTTYAAVKADGLNGHLVGGVTYQSGLIGMPQGGHLSDCNITIITNWVKSGCPQ